MARRKSDNKQVEVEPVETLNENIVDEGVDTEDVNVEDHAKVTEVVEPVIEESIEEKVEEVKEPEPVVKVEEKKIVEPVKEEPVVKVEEKSTSGKNTVEWYLTEAPQRLKSIANQIESYIAVMKKGVPFDENKMVRKQYEMVNIFRTVIEADSYNEFKVKFDLLNTFFMKHKDDALSGLQLSRFDYLWQWSSNELNTLLYMGEVVSQLCDKTTRAKKIKQLNLEMALDGNTTIVSEDSRNNIIRYYTA